MDANTSPLGRESRDTTIGPLGMDCANAEAYRTATSGVRVSPIIPRNPETLMMGSFKMCFTSLTLTDYADFEQRKTAYFVRQKRDKYTPYNGGFAMTK